MKHLYFSVLAVFCAGGLLFAQQIPNAGFETWSGGKPVSWDASNESVYGTAFTTVTRDQTTPYSGGSAVKIETLTKTVLLVQQVTLPGLITLGEFTLDVANETATVTGGIPFPYRPAKLKGWYKAQPGSGDRGMIGAGFSKLYGGVRDTIGYAELFFTTTVTTWTPFEVDIVWDNQDIPDSVNIVASASDLVTESFVTGSKLWLDDLYFAYSYLSNEDAEICTGDDFLWRGNLYATAGNYYDSLISSEGTDSVFVLNLTVNTLPAYYDVTGGGSYNQGGAGLPVGLSGSEPGITYTLLLDGSPVTTTVGDGIPLSFGNQTAEGTYTIVATNLSTGCASDMNGTAEIVVITGVGINAQENITVFPNPAEDFLYISSGLSIERVILTDINGKVVREDKCSKIDVKGLPSGNYIINVYAAGKNYSRQITIR
jgi:hypothetical protein